MRLRLALASVAGALLVAPSAQAYIHFYGTVGPTATIALKRGDSTNVTRAVHGLRTFVIRDRSAFHNFHLFGPGVDRRTESPSPARSPGHRCACASAPTCSGVTPTRGRWAKTFVVS